MEAAIQSNQMDLDRVENFPPFPKVLPTNFDVNSEPELIEGNILRDEPLASGSHRNISVAIQKIKCRCVNPRSTEDYINAMEDIITRTGIGKTWVRVPMESKMVSKTSREDKRPEKPVLKCHKCGSTSHLANTFTKKTKINYVQVIEEVQCFEEKEESDLDSEVSEDTSAEDYPIENITIFFEVTELHTYFPQSSDYCHTPNNIQDARLYKPKPARESCITSILINDAEAIVNLDTGVFFTCVG
ncbi:hypothetical protein O181_126121 [Austropuccinia psidii MF-1]|uniref:Uncharacterized protein n=1 Tax=Austropuccinia psidii MF-1 TaxID=1389203 RepID=A0A9Q3KUH6_9BASI|nr:hypothetical protein [Austropuccinia psidii MF-1]